MAYTLEEDPTFHFTEEMMSLKFSERCRSTMKRNYHNLSRLLPFLYLLSLAGCSSAATGSAAPLLLPVSPHSIFQTIRSVACCGVSAIESDRKRERVLTLAAQSRASKGKSRVKEWEREEGMVVSNCVCQSNADQILIPCLVRVWCQKLSMQLGEESNMTGVQRTKVSFSRWWWGPQMLNSTQHKEILFPPEI